MLAAFVESEPIFKQAVFPAIGAAESEPTGDDLASSDLHLCLMNLLFWVVESVL